MSNKPAMLLLSVFLVSLLIASGCEGKFKDTKADMAVPPPLPEEEGDDAVESGQPPAPPSSSAPPALPSG